MREAADDDRAELVAKAADLSLRARITTARNAESGRLDLLETGRR